MSAFTKIAAYTERNTSVNAKAPSDLLAEFHKAQGWEFPFSGDMLAVLALDTRPRQYRRRLAATHTLQEVEL